LAFTVFFPALDEAVAFFGVGRFATLLLPWCSVQAAPGLRLRRDAFARLSADGRVL
jgi:hypothetical protein